MKEVIQLNRLSSTTNCNKVTVLGKFLNYKFRSQGFCVIRLKVLHIDHRNGIHLDFSVDDEIFAVGNLPDMNIEAGTELIVSGSWENSKYGYRLNIQSLAISDPVDVQGILAYLSSGVIKGIGPVLARRIVEHFGADTLRILDNDPARLLEIKGIGNKSLESIVASWKSERAVSRILMMLCSFGLSVGYARKVFEKFGYDSVKIVQNNPYQLIDICGIGFLRADAIARNLNIPKDSPYRIQSAQIYCLNEAAFSEGHCFLPQDELFEQISVLTGLEKHEISNILCANPHDAVVVSDDKIYLRSIFDAERCVSEKLSALLERNSTVELDVQQEFLTDEQFLALKHILSRPFSILTGGPGTGKTTVLKSLTNALQKAGLSFCLAAPTGKAAKRLTEVTGCPATTIHRLLGYNSKEFLRNESNPLPYKFVIVDEASMIDILLMSALLKAIPKESFLVLVGDVDQLPSVGPGNVLRDIIQLRPDCCFRLTTVHRQAQGSDIIVAAHMINRGQSIRYVLAKDEDVSFIPIDDPHEIHQAVVDLVAFNEFFKPEDVQVLTPIKKGIIGTNELNKSIKKALAEYNLNYVMKIAKNFVDPQFFENKELINKIEEFSGFRPGDKVIQLRNNYDKDVYNGEIGYVIDGSSEDRFIRVLFDDRVVVYQDYDLEELSLAYALTVHKSQGSEFPAVVFVAHPHHYIMLYRNLLYTAVSRAKQKLYIVGSQKAINIAIHNDRPIKRYTNLTI